MLEKINDDALENVTGGATRDQRYEARVREFDKAWLMTHMERKYSGIGGMDRSELFEEWLNRGDMSAMEFLAYL